MKRWNSWGLEENPQTTKLNPQAQTLLNGLIGEAQPLPDAQLDDVVAKVPVSRLPEHDLITTDAQVRVRHTRGQSLSDWLALHSGELGVFPDGVAYPSNANEVQQLLQLAKEHTFNIIPYGGGSSVVGHITPVKSERAVLTVDMSRMNRLISIDHESLLATFGAGTPGPLVESQLAKHGYTLGHFPQSWEFATLGGWVASRSSGQQSLRYGRIEQLFAAGALETPQGTLTMTTCPASSAGPDIREMVLGSEGRLGILSEVSVRISKLPETESFHVVFFPSWSLGIEAVRQLAQQKVQLSMIRLSNVLETYSQLQMADDQDFIANLQSQFDEQGFADEKVMLTFAVTGDQPSCESALTITQNTCRQFSGLDSGTVLGEHWKQNRFQAGYLREPLWQFGYLADTMETAVDWCNVTHAVEAIEQAIATALSDENESVLVYSHLSHVYSQGSSIYSTFLFRCADSYSKTLLRWQKIKTAGALEIVKQGGTISHQHGVGMDHKQYLPAEKGTLGIAAIQALSDFFDPLQQMNPDKLL
jgi:alkyldihydroxyacetonephosphate synthase